MINRRELVIALGATGVLAACQEGPPKPSTVTLNFSESQDSADLGQQGQLFVKLGIPLLQKAQSP